MGIIRREAAHKGLILGTLKGVLSVTILEKNELTTPLCWLWIVGSVPKHATYKCGERIRRTKLL